MRTPSSPSAGATTLPSDGMTAVPFPRISWLKVGSLTWPMGMAVPLTGAAIIFSSFSSPPNNFLSDPNILAALIVAATNEALRKVEQENQAVMSKLTGGLGGLGGGLPF